MKSWRGMVLLPALLALLGAASGAEAETYRVIDLGASGGYSSPTGLNNVGQVVGRTGTDFWNAAPFLYGGGDTQGFGPFPNSFPAAINDAGTVVGTYAPEDTFSVRVFTLQNGQVLDLGALGGTEASANDINNRGDVVGVWGPPGGPTTHAYLYQNGQVRDLGSLGGSSWALAVNNRGDVLGGSYANDGTINTVLWRDGVMRDLGPRFTGTALNDHGVIVGGAYMADNLLHAVRWTEAGLVEDLGTFGVVGTMATDVNNHGLIVGTSSGWDYVNDRPLPARGFVYRDGSMRDLNDLIASDSGWVITAASLINDLGQIAVEGLNAEGQTHALLLTPEPVGEAPEPASVVLLGLGAAGVAGYAWRSRRTNPASRGPRHAS